MLEDRTLTCEDCGKEWTFTADEQEWFMDKGFINEPKRCMECRRARRMTNRPSRQTYPIVCEKCGANADVLHPDMRLCRNCYKQSQQSEG